MSGTAVPPTPVAVPPAIKSAKPGSKLKKRKRAADVRTQLAELRTYLAQDMTDFEIAEAMEIGAAIYNQLKREFYRQETLELNGKPIEQTYIDYVAQQRRNIKDLDQLIERAKTTTQFNALVGAIKARSDIQDKIIRVGQETGILDKAPEKKVILHGVAVANMDNNSLRRMIVDEMRAFGSAVGKYGFTDMDGRPLGSGEAMPELPAAVIEAPDFSAKGFPAKALATGKSDAGKASAVARKKAMVAPAAAGR